MWRKPIFEKLKVFIYPYMPRERSGTWCWQWCSYKWFILFFNIFLQFLFCRFIYFCSTHTLVFKKYLKIHIVIFLILMGYPNLKIKHIPWGFHPGLYIYFVFVREHLGTSCAYILLIESWHRQEFTLTRFPTCFSKNCQPSFSLIVLKVIVCQLFDLQIQSVWNWCE